MLRETTKENEMKVTERIERAKSMMLAGGRGIELGRREIVMAIDTLKALESDMRNQYSIGDVEASRIAKQEL